MSIFLFIIWGTIRTLTWLGYVADFCPICRQTRPFSVSRVSRAEHIYYISFSEGALVGYLAQCQTCHINLSANPILYQTVSKTLYPDLASLIQGTFPNLNQHYRTRLEVEEQIKRNPRFIPADTRAILIEEPFHLLSPLAEARLSGKTHFNRESGFGCLFTIVMFFLFCMLLNSMPNWLVVYGWLIVLAGIIYTIVQLVLFNQRYVDREVVSLLASCLKPLDPTLDELQGCLNKLSILKQRLGRRLNAQKLLTAIERSGVDSFHTSNR